MTPEIRTQLEQALAVINEIPSPEQDAEEWWLELLLDALGRREYDIIAAEAKALAAAPRLIRVLLDSLATLQPSPVSDQKETA